MLWINKKKKGLKIEYSTWSNKVYVGASFYLREGSVYFFVCECSSVCLKERERICCVRVRVFVHTSECVCVCVFIEWVSTFACGRERKSVCVCASGFLFSSFNTRTERPFSVWHAFFSSSSSSCKSKQTQHTVPWHSSRFSRSFYPPPSPHLRAEPDRP